MAVFNGKLGGTRRLRSAVRGGVKRVMDRGRHPQRVVDHRTQVPAWDYTAPIYQTDAQKTKGTLDALAARNAADAQKPGTFTPSPEYAARKAADNKAKADRDAHEAQKSKEQAQDDKRAAQQRQRDSALSDVYNPYAASDRGHI